MSEEVRKYADDDTDLVKGRPENKLDIDAEIVDCDAHIRESVEDLLPYIPDGEERKYVESPYFQYPTDGWDRSAGGRSGYATVRGPEQEEQVMDDLSLDVSIITPTMNLYHGLLGNREVANALARAFNDYIVDEWLDYDSSKFKSGVLVPVHDPEVAAEEIDRHGDEDGIVGVCLNPLGPEKALGDERYDPIYEAAERHDLTIIMHGAATTHSSYPNQTNYFHKFLEVHTISHIFQQMTQVVSLLSRGVVERFPDLRFACLEAGLGWVPFIYRLDEEFLARQNEAPHLEKLPSEYFKDQFWVASQPLEETANIEALADLAGGWENILFATDWPHWDFDSPSVIQDMVPSEYQSQVWSENAYDAFPQL